MEEDILVHFLANLESAAAIIEQFAPVRNGKSQVRHSRALCKHVQEDRAEGIAKGRERKTDNIQGRKYTSSVVSDLSSFINIKNAAFLFHFLIL